MKVGNSQCYALVDSGAGISLCSVSILNDSQQIDKNEDTRITGVTGNHLMVLITDASSYAVGAILSQKGEDNLLHPICYGSSVLTDAQRKWSTVQRELYSWCTFAKSTKISF